MKKWMRIMMALVFVSSILMMGAAWAQAAGGITDDSGNTYTNLHTAFSAVPDGGNVTFTITGEVYASTGNNGMAELTQNASVTLLAGSSDAVIRGNIISSGGGTLTFGSGDAGNPLLLKGRIIVSSGTLMTNSEFRAENGYSVTATYNDTICLGGIGATGKVTAYINGGSFYNGNTTAIFAAGENVTLAHIKDAEIISENNSDGTVNATDGAKIERIENCVIRGKSYGIRATGEKSNIGALLGNRVQAGADAVEITAGASVNTIVSGVYIGGVNGVNNQGILQTIDSKAGETLVFYGKTGYAIDNANEQGGIIVEPILETDLPFQGYARYLGAKGQFAQPETFPMYTPENVRYHMSTSTEPVAGIAGAAFHYLIVDENRKFTITYDLNGGTLAGQAGPIRETYPFGADISLREAPEKAGYAFDYWKGSSYQPGDPYRVKGDHTFTAQWKPRAAAPQTGDHDRPVLWLAILALSTAGIAAVRLGRRRRASR